MKKDKTQNKSRRLVAIIASAVVVVSIASVTAFAYNSPYSYVSLDVNPSIEYSVNRFDKVLSAEAMNGDGGEILENLDLKYMNIDDALESTIQEIKDVGYFSETEEGEILITTYSEDEQKADELTATLDARTQEVIDQEDIVTVVEVVGVGRERVLEAQKLGVTPGKLNLLQKLQASTANPDSVLDKGWLKCSVKQIMQQIEENKRENAKSNKNNEQQTETNDPKQNEPPSETVAPNKDNPNNGNVNKEKEPQSSKEPQGSKDQQDSKGSKDQQGSKGSKDQQGSKGSKDQQGSKGSKDQQGSKGSNSNSGSNSNGGSNGNN